MFVLSKKKGKKQTSDSSFSFTHNITHWTIDLSSIHLFIEAPTIKVKRFVWL